ncbi:MAG: hypothetical protein H0W09_02475 [Solirubrobacterales bacterium]|nr:hypothetical protein [Solirubrobacterales bacterium]
MGFRERFRRLGAEVSRPHPDGEAELVVGDASYDDWDVVTDYAELETARAFRQSLTDRGQRAVLTADWPLDEFGRGDIALRVPPGMGIEAEEMLDDPEE